MALTKWLPPTRRHSLETDQDRVTWLELFFDLVYVAALIQLGDELSDDVTWGGVGRFVGVFIVLWWTWTGTTAYTNRFAVDDVIHRVLVFLQMFAVANVALFAVGPNDNRWTWLAVAYVASRIPLILMYVRMLGTDGEARALARVYIASFSIGAMLWGLSIFAGEPLRFVIWGVAIAFEFLAPIVAVGKLTGPPTHEHHFRERYAIFTIIVFGETFVKTLTELAEVGASVQSQVFGGGVFLIAVGLWWTYFDDVADSNVRRGRPLTGVGWAYTHLPLAAALTAFGVGSKKIVVVESFDAAITSYYLWLFAGSIAATLVATAVLDLFTISPHHAVRERERVVPSLVAAAGVLLIAAVFDSPALLVVLLLAALVVGQIAFEVGVAYSGDRRTAARVSAGIGQAGDGCADLATAQPAARPSELVCEACLEMNKQWVELRQCQICGHVGCCDDSPGRHAREHWQHTDHSIMASLEPGAEWAYCFAHDAVEDPWSARLGAAGYPQGRD